MSNILLRLRRGAESLQSEVGATTARDLGVALLLAAVVFIAFAALAPIGLINGDAAVYAQQIATLDFSERATHIGYYLLGAIPAALLPGFGDHGLNLMSAAFGALSVGMLYLIGRPLLGGIGAGVSALVLATNWVFVRNSVFAEVYVVQAFFLLLSLLFWLRGASVSSGLAFGASVLVSPTTLLAVPTFALLRPRLRAFGIWALTGAALVLAVLAPVLRDYLFGGRGLLTVAGASQGIAAAVFKEGLEVFVGFFVLLPLVLFGALEALANSALRHLTLAIALLWATLFVFGEKFSDVPIQLPTYILICLFAGVGLRLLTERPLAHGPSRLALFGLPGGALALAGVLWLAQPRLRGTSLELPELLPTLYLAALAVLCIAALALFRRRRQVFVTVLVTLALGINGSMAWALVSREAREADGFRDSVLEASRNAPTDYLAVGGWSRGILFEHYLYADAYTGSWIDVAWLEGHWGADKQAEAQSQWRGSLEEGREIWLLEELPAIESELTDRGYRFEPVRMIRRATRETTPR